ELPSSRADFGGARGNYPITAIIRTLPLRRVPQSAVIPELPTGNQTKETDWTGTQLDTELAFVSSPSANRLDTITTEHSYGTYCHCASSRKVLDSSRLTSPLL